MFVRRSSGLPCKLPALNKPNASIKKTHNSNTYPSRKNSLMQQSNAIQGVDLFGTCIELVHWQCGLYRKRLWVNKPIASIKQICRSSKHNNFDGILISGEEAERKHCAQVLATACFPNPTPTSNPNKHVVTSVTKTPTTASKTILLRP